MSYTPTVSGVSSAIPKWAVVSSVALGSSATTTVIDVTEAGILLSVHGQVSSAVGGTNTAYLKVTIDGVAGDNLYLYNVSTTWNTTSKMFIFSGDGTVVDDRMLISLGIPYRTSCKVELVVSPGGGASGAVNAAALRAKSN